MNWGKLVVAGVAAGIAKWLADFVMHPVILGDTYKKYAVFTQEDAGPWWFLVISICIALTVAILFAKTRDCWAAGVGGGLTFGFFVGVVSFFPPFYNALVLEGFPYFLVWCWGGVNLIGAVVMGIVLGLIYK